LRDGDGHAIGYLKYAEKEAARRRLQQEHVILSNLPDGVGPKPARLGALGNGKALLTSALSGRPLPITLPPPENLTNLLDSLIVSPPVPFESHPWVRQAPNRENPELDAWCERLGDRNWPVVIAHGDFAPWNLLRSTNGAVLAIDWEYGTLRGFPYLDLAYYVLQTLALVYRQTPSEALWYTTEYLSRQRSCSLNNKEAEALVRLTAYDAYQKALVDGHSAEADLQAWRRAIWEGTTRP
jgi:hypothetical protein